jgi:N-carbamoyl-L-amino-acid hydrolase
VERIAADHDGVGTTGQFALEPNIPTAVAGMAELAVDLRHPDAAQLERMLEATRARAREAAAARGCELGADVVWRIDPIPFDETLVSIALDEARAAGGRREPLTSGALHDAAEVARHKPVAMAFAPSKAGLSHASAEDTDEADLTLAIETFGRVAARVSG